MGNESSSVHETEFVFRRLTEGLHLGGKEVSPYVWLAVLVPVFVLAIFYVAWMYRRDAHSVGWRWAAFLATLRSIVYAILAIVFLLPAWQTWDRTEHRSKVVLLLDVSGSMNAKDDVPTDTIPVDQLLTRKDKVVRFLTDAQVAFLQRLRSKNPVTAYRFGTVLDDEFRSLDGEKQWSLEDWKRWLNPNPKRELPAEALRGRKGEAAQPGRAGGSLGQWHEPRGFALGGVESRIEQHVARDCRGQRWTQYPVDCPVGGGASRPDQPRERAHTDIHGGGGGRAGPCQHPHY